MAPERLKLCERCLGAPNLVGVCTNQPLTARRGLGDESCGLEDGDVLLDGGERHVVLGCERTDGRLTCEGTPQDIATGGVGERAEELVELGLCEGLMCNHMVVYVGGCDVARLPPHNRDEARL